MTDWFDDPGAAEALRQQFPDWKPQRPAQIPEYRAPVVANGVVGDREAAYARVALTDQTEELARMGKDSGRNDFLNTSAFKMRQYISSGWLTQNEVIETLLGACRRNGLMAEDTEAQCLKTIYSGLQGGERRGAAVVDWHEGLQPRVQEVTAESLGLAPTFDPEAPEKPTEHAIPGGVFIFNAPETIPALWGTGEQVLWSEGEALMIAGNQGLGKTTLAGQLINAQLFGGKVLDLPVHEIDGKVLYLAMDRPRQIARSMRRQFDETQRELLDEKLTIWPGPPPEDMAKNPLLLASMAEHFGAEVVYIDSLKDAAIGLSNEEVSSAYNRSRQYLVAAGKQVCELHHNIKRAAEGRGWTAADVYGSVWLTSGCGSIIMLTGEPGDPLIKMNHVKQPAEEVGPLTLLHEQATGQLTIHHQVDAIELATHAGAEGLTAKGVACAMFQTDAPTPAEVQKARRKLEKLTTKGLMTQVDGQRGGAATCWFAATHLSVVEMRSFTGEDNHE